MKIRQQEGGCMKKFIENIIIIMVLTVAILFSYAVMEKKISGKSSSEFINFLFNTQEKASDNKNTEKDSIENPIEKGKKQSDTMDYKAVWLSYLEFNSYRKSVKNNNEKNFRKFYKYILQRIKLLGFNRIIVQVRPFGDALYESQYFPWAACISGKQGKNLGYDPLKIMTEMSHQENIAIEAWINPYRISSGDSIQSLSKTNPAKIWFSSQNTKRNVLSYNGSLYYNPSSESVRNLIIKGVEEIVQNYDVDGIHMDDYFYPAFTEKNVGTAFDAPEYEQQIKSDMSSAYSPFSSSNKSSNEISLADWRRDNVNRLVSGIYKIIKESNPQVTFGISPAGNLDNLRNDLEYYVDIDTWVSQNGYVDYLIPQIYWGFTNEIAPFDKVTDEWAALMKDSSQKLYIGLQLYRMGSTEPGQSDKKELQKASLLKKELSYLKKKKKIEGYCLFSYQYLDCQNKEYHFDAEQFSTKRKKLLNQIVKSLKNNS